MRIVEAAGESCKDAGSLPPQGLAELLPGAREYVRALSAGLDVPGLAQQLGPSELCELLAGWTVKLGRRRVVLLLDDAAHAFAPQQQREFFEIFRELRTRQVAAKAAVYPGITTYSPYMHVGHEAELIEAWYRPDTDDFLEVMRGLVALRLPDALAGVLAGREELVDLLALASFGLPRGFLVMLSELLGVEGDESPGFTPTRRRADSAIAAHAESVRSIFTSLSEKIPRYSHFVTVGSELERAIARSLREFNAQRSPNTKAVVIGLADPLGPELSKVLEMLEYAGLIRPQGTVSRGVKGVFHRYELHYAIMLAENSLALGQRGSTPAVISSLRSRDAHAFARSRGSALLGDGFQLRCTLDLEPCQECGAARISESAKFCMTCGRPLTEASLYEELLQTSIEYLPLTQKKREALLADTQIRTVNDVLIDEESREVRKAHRVGPVWAARIRRYAEEFVSV